MAESIVCRLQTPEDANGVRKDVNILTSSEAIIMPDDTTLEDKLEQVTLQVSSEKPVFPCVWAKVIRSETI